MCIHNDVLRDIYVSDIILADKESKMMEDLDDSYFDKIETLLNQSTEKDILLSHDDVKDLEKSFNEFYFEYGFIQFKRGLEIGLQLRDIH